MGWMVRIDLQEHKLSWLPTSDASLSLSHTLLPSVSSFKASIDVKTPEDDH